MRRRNFRFFFQDFQNLTERGEERGNVSGDEGNPEQRTVDDVGVGVELVEITVVHVAGEQQVVTVEQNQVGTDTNRKTQQREDGIVQQGVGFCLAGGTVGALVEAFDGTGFVAERLDNADTVQDILQENLQLFGIDDSWTSRWYNAQMIFNAQTDGSSSQKALKTALEMFEIEPSRPAHDALGDAYHTALICAMLNLKKGISEYDQALKNHDNGFHGAELPGCIARKVFYDYADKRAALSAMSGEENKCPTCGRQMLSSRWFAQPGHRYMDLATCPEHGKFLIRIRMSEQADGLTRVSRLTDEATSEAAANYARRAEKADPQEQRTSRRRRRRRAASQEIRSSQSGETASKSPNE